MIRGPWRDRFGQVVAPEHRAVRQGDARLDGILQLADVPRPGMPQQGLHGVGGDLGDLGAALGLCLVLLEEVHGQQRDVLGAVAERGQVDPDHVQAVEQVGAEPALLDLLLQDLVAGRDDPDLDLDRLGAAHALELPGLEDAQQLGLEGGRDVAGLVEQQRPAVGQLEPADLAPLGAGEGTLLVPEQLVLEQRVVEDRAVRAPRTARSGACRPRGRPARPAPCPCRSRPGSAPSSRSDRPARSGRRPCASSGCGRPSCGSYSCPRRAGGACPARRSARGGRGSA